MPLMAPSHYPDCWLDKSMRLSATTYGQFHKEYWRYFSIKCVQKLPIWHCDHISQGSMSWDIKMRSNAITMKTTALMVVHGLRSSHRGYWLISPWRCDSKLKSVFFKFILQNWYIDIDLATNGNSGCANDILGCAKCHFWWKSPLKWKNLGDFRVCN